MLYCSNNYKLIQKYLIRTLLIMGIVIFSWQSSVAKYDIDLVLISLEKKITQKYTPTKQKDMYKMINQKFSKICPLLKKYQDKKNCRKIEKRAERKLIKLNDISLNLDIKNIKEKERTSQFDYTIDSLPRVDLNKIQQTWIQWHNDERKKYNLPRYTMNYKLNYSASVWAKYLAKIGNWTHKRKETDAFYNYYSILEWFNQQGVFFAGKGTRFTESVGMRGYTCKKDDCTTMLLAQIKKTFDFFMSEKNSNGPHYRAIVHKYFDQIGLGVFIHDGRYYLVSHYANGVKE